MLYLIFQLLKCSVRESVSPGLRLQRHMSQPSPQSHQAWTPSFCYLPGHGMLQMKTCILYITIYSTLSSDITMDPLRMPGIVSFPANIFFLLSSSHNNRRPGPIITLFSVQVWPIFSSTALRKNVNTVWNCSVTFVCEDTTNLTSYLHLWYIQCCLL